ncbi:MAG: SPOR domain-containing protein [Bacteroidales bacterium]|nr:SPOR domain-containing protein [Bacteroidales bacterium]
MVQNGDGMYRVITGTFSNKDNAEIHRLSLNLDYISSWVWTKY